jgi:hypothetical protein
MMDNNVRGMGAWSTRGDDDASPHLSDLALDQLLTGEVDGTLEAEARRAHLARCAACAGRRREIEEDARRLLAARPTLGEPAATPAARGAAPAAASVRGGWRGLSPRRGRRLFAAVGGMAAAAAALVIAVGLAGRDTRSKGPPLELALFVRHLDGRVEDLLPGGAAVPGEAVRVAVTARRAGYVGLASVDGRGTVTGYTPGEQRLLRIAAGERRVVEGSLVLDATLGPERLLAVLCPERLEVSRLLAAVRERAAPPAADPVAAGRDAVPPELGLGCQQTSFSFLKVAAR